MPPANSVLPRTLLLNAIFIAALVEVVTIPLFGWLSDHIGRRVFYFLGMLFTAAFAFPLFWLLGTKDPLVVVVTVIVALSLGHGTMFGLQSAYFPELFGTRVRYSGASFGFQAAAALGGGFSPIIATALAGSMGGTAGVSVMLILLAAITFAATLCARETRGESLLGLGAMATVTLERHKQTDPDLHTIGPLPRTAQTKSNDPSCDVRF